MWFVGVKTGQKCSLWQPTFWLLLGRNNIFKTRIFFLLLLFKLILQRQHFITIFNYRIGYIKTNFEETCGWVRCQFLKIKSGSVIEMLYNGKTKQVLPKTHYLLKFESKCHFRNFQSIKVDGDTAQPKRMKL